MTARRLSDATVQRQLNSVTEKIGRARGEQRLALLRRQAALIDQRDAAAEAARRAAG